MVEQPEHPALLLPRVTTNASHWRSVAAPDSSARDAALTQIAIALQLRWRMKAARRHRAAARIQACWRGHVTRRRYASGLIARGAARAATATLAALERAAADDSELDVAVKAVVAAFVPETSATIPAPFEGHIVQGTVHGMLGTSNRTDREENSSTAPSPPSSSQQHCQRTFFAKAEPTKFINGADPSAHMCTSCLPNTRRR